MPTVREVLEKQENQDYVKEYPPSSGIDCSIHLYQNKWYAIPIRVPGTYEEPLFSLLDTEAQEYLS